MREVQKSACRSKAIAQNSLRSRWPNLLACRSSKGIWCHRTLNCILRCIRLEATLVARKHVSQYVSLLFFSSCFVCRPFFSRLWHTFFLNSSLLSKLATPPKSFFYFSSSCQKRTAQCIWINQSINGWMNQWINEPMYEWMNEWMNKWMHKWMDEWVNTCINGWTNV